MQEYADKNALISEINKTADIFIKEFEDVADSDKDISYTTKSDYHFYMMIVRFFVIHLLVHYNLSCNILGNILQIPFRKLLCITFQLTLTYSVNHIKIILYCVVKNHSCTFKWFVIKTVQKTV